MTGTAEEEQRAEKRVEKRVEKRDGIVNVQVHGPVLFCMPAAAWMRTKAFVNCRESYYNLGKYYDVGVKRYFDPFDTGLLRTTCSCNPQKHS